MHIVALKFTADIPETFENRSHDFRSTFKLEEQSDSYRENQFGRRYLSGYMPDVTPTIRGEDGYDNGGRRNPSKGVPIYLARCPGSPCSGFKLSSRLQSLLALIASWKPDCHLNFQLPETYLLASDVPVGTSSDSGFPPFGSFLRTWCRILDLGTRCIDPRSAISSALASSAGMRAIT